MFSAADAICFLSTLVLVMLHCPGGSYGAPEKEYFTSIAGLEKLLGTEAFLLDHLQSYVQSMTAQLEMLKSEIEEIEKEHAIAANDLEEYLTSPINAFLLIKRLDKDWTIYEETIKNDESQKLFLEALQYSRENMSFPTEDDTTGSVIGLIRLQETYKLDTSQVAAGIINGVKYGSSMTWQDCFQLGQHLFALKDFNHTIPWLKESYQKLQTQEYYNSSESVAFLEMITDYHVQMGDFKTALDLHNRLLELNPDKEDGQVYKKYLEQMIEEGHVPQKTEPYLEDYTPYRQTEEFQIYAKTCRGELKQTPTEERPLRCKLYHRNVPYRLLMPFKVEERNIDPYIVIFYDVIYDSEIEAIKEYSMPGMSRSQVRTEDGESSAYSLYRTSQNTWLRYDFPETKNVRRRLRHITGLDMRANEDVQVANYGIGGHYEPHFDFFEKDSSFLSEEGNRIATAIFYLSDVELGGATAFPFLKIAVQPKKGSMMFWYNLHEDGKGDYRTKHAACPVLKGSKWVANIWIRSLRQTFRRPCGLQQDHEVSVPYSIIQ